MRLAHPSRNPWPDRQSEPAGRPARLSTTACSTTHGGRTLRRIAIAGIILAGLVSVVALASGCGGGEAPSGVSAANSDPGEAWALSSQPEDVIAAYVFVGAHRSDTRQVPCYCGCAGLQHRSLEDCFLKPSGGYEEHASGCAVCRDEATDLKRFIDQGQDARTARAYIDTQYSKLGKPTDTP